MEALHYWLAHQGLTILFILVGSSLLYWGGTYIISFFTKQLVKGKGRALPRKDVEKREKTLVSLTTSIWRIVIAVMTVISIFKVIFPGLELSPLFASAGIVGVAVAFGSQALVKDLLTGLFIVSENQYRIGDIVTINDAEGRVEHIGARTTILRDNDGNVHYLPNGSISHVVNKTMGYSRVNFSLSIAPSNDLDMVISLINQVGDELAADKTWKSKIIEAPHFDSIGTFSASSVDITIIGKVQPSDQWRVTAEMRRRLLEEFNKADIKLA